MSILKLDQQPRAYKDPVTKKIEFTYVPIIPIRLSYKHKVSQFTIDCLLDSGADRNIFPADYARILGIDIKKGVLVQHIGIGEASLLAYAHKVKLFVGSYNIETVVDFSEEQTVPLLGREGFIKYFKKTVFNRETKQVELEY